MPTRPGQHLRAQEAPGELGRPVHERAPRARVGVHERAGREVVLRGSALGEVRGERERRAREADERRRGARTVVGLVELGDRALDRLGDGSGCLVEPCRIDARQLGDGRGIRVPPAEDGTATGLDLDVDADELQRHHDVAEEDAGIDRVAAHRLQRDLARHRGVEAGVEHPRADAEVAVLGQRPARLAHEPHGSRVAPLSSVGADETRVAREAGGKGVLGGEDHA
ncbi:MAG: hypothetical protein K0S05_450 [Agromyces sp.]|nr:hypothetical protein [Agromyces sp.]